jgi:hypothetical protein
MWPKKLRKYLLNRIIGPEMQREVEARIAAIAEQKIRPSLADRKCFVDKPWNKNLCIPPMDLFRFPRESLMQYSTSNAEDFYRPRFAEITP